jgi:hypothetical protein
LFSKDLYFSKAICEDFYEQFDWIMYPTLPWLFMGSSSVFLDRVLPKSQRDSTMGVLRSFFSFLSELWWYVSFLECILSSVLFIGISYS